MGDIIEKLRFMDGKYINPDATHNVISYALQHSDTSPIGGSAVFPIRVDSAEKQFLLVKERFHQLDGRKVAHVCLCYPDNTPASKTCALKDAKEVSRKIGTEFQNVYGIHENTDNVHIHFAINSVNYRTGIKITSEKIKELLS